MSKTFEGASQDSAAVPPKARILVQDDEEPIREVIALVLNHEGYECVPVSEPSEALQVLRSDKIDLVISGIIEWPEASFHEMIHAFPDVPVIVMSSAAWALKLGVERGSSDSLQKPFEREQLFNAVRRAVECRKVRLNPASSQTR